MRDRDEYDRLRKEHEALRNALSTLPPFRVGADVIVQPASLTIEVDGQVRKAEKQLMLVLVVMARAPGTPFTKEELLNKAWGGRDLTDAAVEKSISQLRTLLGDSARASRRLTTKSGSGYTLVGPVTGLSGARENPLSAPAWSGNPYVGLTPFDERHAAVFCGRKALVESTLKALRDQRNRGDRLVMLVGSSGSGKTSLLRAGVLPALKGGTAPDGMRALAVAHCDLAAAQPGEALTQLSATLLADWALDKRKVFDAPNASILAATLAESPEYARHAVAEAWNGYSEPVKGKEKAEHAHLLLVIDHAEALVSLEEQQKHPQQAQRFEAVIEALCEHPHASVFVIVRGDRYAQLAEAMPRWLARKGGDGHIDVAMPQPGDIAEMIRSPAHQARLRFGRDEATSVALDDTLRDATVGQPDALPLLQHMLHALYEARSADGELLYATYETLGGLEGALAQRADQIFNGLDETVRARLPAVLTLLTRIETDSDRITAVPVLQSALPDDNARALVQSFIAARLFVAGHNNGRPDFRVAHEALLRQWPTAHKWINDYRGLLLAHARLRHAAKRWEKEHRSDDHLLNPGQPLSEAQNVVRRMPELVDASARDFIAASGRVLVRRRRLRTAALLLLAATTLISIILAYTATESRRQAEARRREAQRLADFLLVDLAAELRTRDDLKMLNAIADEALLLLKNRDPEEMSAKELTTNSRAYVTTGEVLLTRKEIERAFSAFQSAEESARLALNHEPKSFDVNYQAAQIPYYLGAIHFARRNFDATELEWNRYLRFSRKIQLIAPKNREGFIEESSALNNLGALRRELGDYDGAISYFIASRKIKSDISRIAPDDMQLKADIIDTESWIASAKEANGNLFEAADGYEDVIAAMHLLLRKEPNANRWKFSLARYHLLDADLALAMGRPERAKHAINEAQKILLSLAVATPENRLIESDLGYAYILLASIAYAQRDTQAALIHVGKAQLIANRQLSSGNNGGDEQRWQRLQGRIDWMRGRMLQDPRESDKAVKRLETLFRDNPKDTHILHELCAALLARLQTRLAVNDTAGATQDMARIDKIVLQSANSTQFRLIAPWVAAHALATPRMDEHHKPAEEKARWLKRIGYREPFFEIAQSTPVTLEDDANGRRH